MIIGKISSRKSLTVFRNRDVLSDGTRMCCDKQDSGAWRIGPISGLPKLAGYNLGHSSFCRQFIIA
ncbi:hypothetical protein [Methanospirillum lacunae]|uniref:hypothetical protein n=1 Tax=Methanospirillum lacunae TaxID=668570 RepID=UPI0038FCFF93